MSENKQTKPKLKTQALNLAQDYKSYVLKFEKEASKESYDKVKIDIILDQIHSIRENLFSTLKLLE